MEVQAPQALYQFLYRNTISNFPVEENFFHCQNVKRNLCQYSEISIDKLNNSNCII